MPSPKELVPSMFHRRLLLLALGAVVAFGLLGVRAAQLTIGRGEELLRLAESRLISESWQPTIRGRILDRHGRILARDEPSWDILLDYTVITEKWAVDRARALARREHPESWPTLGDVERLRVIERYVPVFTERLDSMFDELAGALEIERSELDQRFIEIIQRVSPMADYVRERQRRARERELNEGRRRRIEVTLRDVAQPIAEERSPHVIASAVNDRIANVIRRMAERDDKHPGLHVRPSGRRSYPRETMTVTIDREGFPAPVVRESPDPVTVTIDGVGTHLLGWMREAQREDFEREPMRVDGEVNLKHYKEGDTVGATGIEEAAEHLLRGSRGRTILHHDTEEREVTPARPGRDVPLTIDIELQARVHGLMRPEVGLAVVQEWHKGRQELALPIGTPLNGAAVVLDIENGEILAMVSTPSFTREAYAERAQEMWNDEVDAPLINKAVAKPYPPGSVVKPLVLTAAITEGRLGLNEGIECHGHLLPNNPNMLRCWYFKQYGSTHTGMFGGPLRGDRAIEVSCNVFFYTLGQRLGFETLQEWYHRFGVGETFDIGVGMEYAGNAGDVIELRGTESGHAIQMGIGQGPLEWTPLHAAHAYATLARDGGRLIPRLIRNARPEHESIMLDPAARDLAMRGLYLSVNGEWGTGRLLTDHETGVREPIFNVPGVAIWGKTGTATAPRLFERDADGEIVFDEVRTEGGETRRVPRVAREGDHSWFVILAGPEGGLPRYAVAVIMEYAGSGGRVSGPIANQIVRALVEMGYLEPRGQN